MNYLRDQFNELSAQKITTYVSIAFFTGLFVDNLNGALKFYDFFPISVGQTYRLIVFVGVLIISLIIMDMRSFIKAYSFLFVAFVLIVFYSLVNKFNLSQMIKESINIMKLIYPMAVITIITHLIRLKKTDNDFAENILNVYMIVIPLTLLIPFVLNIGYPSYALGGGTKGFYHSKNEIALVSIVIMLYSMRHFLRNRTKINVTVFLLNIFSVIAIGTKAGLVVTACALLFSFVCSYSKEYKRIYILVCIIVPLLGFLVFKNQVSEMILRITYFYQQITDKGGSFLDFLTSGRTDRIFPNIKNLYLTGNGISNLLFGVSREIQVDNSSYVNRMNTLLEMDFLDTLFWYGLAMMTYVFKIYLVPIVAWLKSKDIDYLLVGIYLFVFAYSFFLGHVLYSPLASGSLVLIYFTNAKKNMKGGNSDEDSIVK